MIPGSARARAVVSAPRPNTLIVEVRMRRAADELHAQGACAPREESLRLHLAVSSDDHANDHRTNSKRFPVRFARRADSKPPPCFAISRRIGTGKGSEKGHKDDLALIVSDVPAAVAGMFTTNQVCAAPVKVSAKRVKNLARAIVVNSGNANACTGRQGMLDAEEMTRLLPAGGAL